MWVQVLPGAQNNIMDNNQIELFERKVIIPKEVIRSLNILTEGGFEAYLVGGCVRDLIMNRKPRDWDITTNANPEQIISLFPKTFYENTFGTVGIVNEDSEDETLKIIEITPYRFESDYADHRHPNSVKFANRVEDDLSRRDFTINALALSIKDNKAEIKDMHNGRKDILDKTLRTVGNPNERFQEDALRMLRAVRLVSELGFTLNIDTKNAIRKNAELISKISQERIRDEFIKIVMSPSPMIGMLISHETGLLKHFLPELEKGIGMEQRGEHIYDVWTHLLKSLQHSADKNYPLETRISALFHDIGKPDTRYFSRETNQYTFHNHELVGSRVTKKVLERLRFPVKTIEKVVKMVRWHMFFSDTEQITLSAVRRMVVNVGRENIWDLVNLRMCDRIGTGRPKESPYRLRKYQAMIEEALRDPISVNMLKIDGKGIMDVTHENPGPKIGYILHALLEEVLEDPKLNTKEYLENKAIELSKNDINTLKMLGESGKNKKEEADTQEIGKIRDKFKVK